MGREMKFRMALPFLVLLCSTQQVIACTKKDGSYVHLYDQGLVSKEAYLEHQKRILDFTL